MAARARGFSLAELLVVIAILGVLLGVLLPTLAAVRRSARVTACASNLRQIGQALLAYRGERRQWPVVKPAYFDLAHRSIPPASMSDDERRVAAAPYLPVALRDFLSMESPVYRCPGDADGLAFDRVATLTGHGTSYIEWIVLYGFRAQRGELWTWLVSDFAGMGWNGGSIPDPVLHARPFRWNVLKTDGSVETVQPKRS